MFMTVIYMYIRGSRHPSILADTRGSNTFSLVRLINCHNTTWCQKKLRGKDNACTKNIQNSYVLVKWRPINCLHPISSLLRSRVNGRHGCNVLKGLGRHLSCLTTPTTPGGQSYIHDGGEGRGCI